MANSYLTPNMDLVIPVPTQEQGPNWAFDLNASLTIVDMHNHTTGQGVQIPTGGININASLPFNNSFSATSLYSTQYYNHSGALTPSVPNVSCAYAVGVDGDLYWNDSNSNSIRITENGSVAISGAVGFTGLPSGTASAAYIALSGTFQFQQATSTGANLDVASIAIRYPGSYPTPSGNYIQLQAPSSLASGYSLTLPALPGQTNVMTLSSAGVIASITYDAVGQDMTSTGANAIGVSMSSTGANAVAASITSVTSAVGNLVGAAMTSTGANAVGASMNSTGANAVAATMTSTGANAVLQSAGALATIHSQIPAYINSSPGYRLAIIRGIISPTGPTILIGEGFTVSYTSGTFSILYTAGFGNTAAVTANATVNTYICTLGTNNNLGVQINVCDPGGTPVNATINFIAIGQI